MDEVKIIQRLSHFAAAISEPADTRVRFIRENISDLDFALDVISTRKSLSPPLFLAAVKCVRLLQKMNRSAGREVFNTRKMLLSLIDVLLVPDYGGFKFDVELMALAMNHRHVQLHENQECFTNELKMHLSNTIMRFLIRVDGPLSAIEAETGLDYVTKACRLVSLCEAHSDSNRKKETTSSLLGGASYLMSFLSTAGKSDPATWVGDVEVQRFLQDKPLAEQFADVRLLFSKKMLGHHLPRNAMFLRDTLRDMCSSYSLSNFSATRGIRAEDFPPLISFSFHIVNFLEERSAEISNLRECIRDMIFATRNDVACDLDMLAKLAGAWNISGLETHSDATIPFPLDQDEMVLFPQFTSEEREATCAIQERILISSSDTRLPNKGFLLMCFRSLMKGVDGSHNGAISVTSTTDAISVTVAEWRSLRRYFPEVLRDLPFSTTPSQLSVVLTDIMIARNTSRESKQLQELRNFSVMKDDRNLQNKTLYLVRAQQESDLEASSGTPPVESPSDSGKTRESSRKYGKRFGKRNGKRDGMKHERRDGQPSSHS